MLVFISIKITFLILFLVFHLIKIIKAILIFFILIRFENIFIRIFLDFDYFQETTK